MLKNSCLVCAAAGSRIALYTRIALYENIYYTSKQAVLIKATLIKTSCFIIFFSMGASQTKEGIK